MPVAGLDKQPVTAWTIDLRYWKASDWLDGTREFNGFFQVGLQNGRQRVLLQWIFNFAATLSLFYMLNISCTSAFQYRALIVSRVGGG